VKKSKVGKRCGACVIGNPSWTRGTVSLPDETDPTEGISPELQDATGVVSAPFQPVLSLRDNPPAARAADPLTKGEFDRSNAHELSGDWTFYSATEGNGILESGGSLLLSLAPTCWRQ
jgi:hypothetical protein